MSMLSSRARAILVALATALVLTGSPGLANETVPGSVDGSTPTVSGTPAVGQLLTAAAGTWSDGATLDYQWFAGETAIEGATSPTVALTEAQLDQAVSVEVTGRSPDLEPTSHRSAPTLQVQRVVTPRLSGTFAVGQRLTATAGAWSSGTSFRHQWYADGKAISGATASSLRLAKAQGGRRITVRVTGSKTGYPTLGATSARSARVFTAAAAPRITGTAAVGRTLSVKRGTWMSGAKVRYQWLVDGIPRRGATGTKLKVPSSAATKRITVRATGTRSGYATVARTSSPTPRVQRVGKPRLSGSTVATRRLSVSAGTWTSGTRFTYSWYLNGKKVSGATGRSITVRSSWKGKRLHAVVRGTRSGYSTLQAKTSRSAKVTLPSSAAPVSSWNCPSWAPIKGNASSMIYHLPRQRFYDATKPEDCFRTESAARNAGYRKAKV